MYKKNWQLHEGTIMRRLGKFYIGSNQAGKGDAVRPKSKRLNEDLFLTREQSKKLNERFKHTVCQLCLNRVYKSRTFEKNEKYLTVGNCCEDKIYL